MAAEKVIVRCPADLLDPLTLPDPWCHVVWHWMHHHPDLVFLPLFDCPGEYRLSWDDLREILVAAGLLDRQLRIM